MSKSIKIFVGLGGFGSSVVQKLHKRTTEKAGVTQPPSHLKFVTYDLDMRGMGENKPDNKSLKTITVKENTEPFYSFLSRLKDTKPQLAGDMAGVDELIREYSNYFQFNHGQQSPFPPFTQFRQFGRVAFLYHLKNQTNNLIECIKKELSDALNKNQVNESNIRVRINLVNSLAGTTGSSSFLDVAHLLQSQLDREFQLMLFTVTGDAAMHKRTEIQNASYKQALSNTYAALTELDYWMDNDPAKKDAMEYPKYGKVEQKTPLFNQCNVICLDNQNGLTLSNWRRYVDYVTNLLDVLEIKSEAGSTIEIMLDQILAPKAVVQSRYASMATGAIFYPHKDALEYVYSFIAEDMLNDLALETDQSQVKRDLENDLTSLGLAEEGYFFDGKSGLNYHREDQVFDKLEDPWTDEFGEMHPYPEVSFELLVQKVNPENLQSVVKDIESYKGKLRRFCNFSRKEVYDSIISALESTVFYGGDSMSLSYMREYLKELKVIMDSRMKGLENYIPEVFEEKEYLNARDNYVEAKARLERKTKKRNLPDFQSAAERYMQAMKLVEKSKAKLDIYEKLSLQLEWYLNAVKELQSPLANSVLKHYKSIRSGLELGTYSNYEREDFNIEALSVQEYKEVYRKFYQDIDKERVGEIERVKLCLKSKLLHLLGKDKSGDVGDKSDRVEALELWEKYTITPQWSSQESTSQNTRVRLIDQDDQVRLKDHLRKLFDSIMNNEFKEMSSGILPKNVMEALYAESKILSRDRDREKLLSDLLKEKLNQLEALVTPFVVFNKRIDMYLSHGIALELSDVDDLFQSYDYDHQLREDADEIYEALLMDRKAGLAGGAQPADSDRISMIKVFSKFELKDIVPFKQKYEVAYDNSNIEHFTSLRIRNKILPVS